MIENFTNKIAKEIWEDGWSKHLPVDCHHRSRVLLTIMHNTTKLDDLRIRGEPPFIRLHKLKGARKMRWSVTIKLPWCITFEYKDGRFSDVKIENYHKG